MNKLTQKDDCGNWGLKGVPWSDLVPGAVITQETYEKVYAALWKLMDYEGTELTPEEVERVNDFDRSQSGIMLKKLNEEQRKHRWIPVSDRLPEDGTYLCTLDGELVGEEEPFTGMCGIENGKWDEEGCVIAWQPLPEPYKGGRQ